jgi:hypothetical protein
MKRLSWPKINEFAKAMRRPRLSTHSTRKSGALPRRWHISNKLSEGWSMDDATRKSKLQEIFDSDSLGLLEIKETPKQERRDEDWRLIEQFGEITQFYEDNQRIPNGDGGDINEYTLAARLDGIRRRSQKGQSIT